MIETTDTRVVSFAHDGKVCQGCGRPIAKPKDKKFHGPQFWGARKWCSTRCKVNAAMRRRYHRRKAC